MATAEQPTTSTKTAQLPGVKPPLDPRPAWPFVTVGVAVGAVIALLAVVLLRNDEQQVRSEPVAPVATTVPAITAPSTTEAAGAVTERTTTMTTRPPRLVYEEARLSLDGLGPVDIGMTPAEASAAAGVEIRIDPRSDLGRGCAHARADSGPQDRGFMVVDGRIVRIEVWGRDLGGARTLTVSGIGAGSTEDEVKRAYPGRITVEGHPYVPGGHYLVYTPADPAYRHLGMVFETDGRIVKTFRAGLAGPVRWIEGCA